MACSTCRWAFHTTCDRHVCGVPNGIAFWFDASSLKDYSACYAEGPGVKVNCSTCNFNKGSDCRYFNGYRCVIQEDLVRRASRRLQALRIGDIEEGSHDYDTVC